MESRRRVEERTDSLLLNALQTGFTPQAIKVLLSYLLSLVVAITMHEAAHAYSAHWCGDPTPRKQGRLSLNPLDHLDPMGTLFILLAGFGWGKPVIVNPFNFREVRRDMMITSAAGPLTNLLLAGVGVGAWHLAKFALAAAPGASADFAFTLLLLIQVFVTLNLSLMLFNLLPVGPLDGVKVVQWFLPDRLAASYYEFNMRYGNVLLFGLIILMYQVPAVGSALFWPVHRVLDLMLALLWPLGRL